MRRQPNPAVDLAPFGRWTLRDKAAQRRSPLRWASPNPMASPSRTAPNGHLPMHCATVPVDIGSPYLSHVDRHSVRVAGRFGFLLRGRCSTAAEIFGVGLSLLAPLSFNAKAVCPGSAPEGAGMSQRLARCSFTSTSCMGQPLRPNPAVDPAPSGRWTLRDKAAQRRSPLRWASKFSKGTLCAFQPAFC